MCGLTALGCTFALAAEKKPFVHEWQKQAAIEKPRLEKIQPVAAGALRVEPMFSSVSVVYGAARTEGLAFEYRPAGGAWQKAAEPIWFDEVANYRGMTWGLEEDTDYELRVTAGGQTLAEARFRTWKSDVPVARTVEIDPATAKFPMTVSDRGTPDGWVRYVVKGGATLQAKGPENGDLITVKGAAYVLFDGIRIEAPGVRRVFRLEESVGVRFRNCDISRYGVLGTQRLDFSGRYYTGWDRQKNRPRGGNWCCAIEVGKGMSETVIERCYVHDPIGRSISWRYSHPAGPVAVCMKHPAHSTVIRYNDFVGSDAHRWDDAVGGHGNFDPDGGFNRTGEVYGNFMIFPNDDAIELDGGQQNVICYRNRFEGGLCGVSIQGNVVSPSYVVDNLFSGMDDEMGEPGQTIKTAGFDIYGQGPYSLVQGNVLWGRGSGLHVPSSRSKDPRHPSRDAGRIARIDVIGNTFCDAQQFGGAESVPGCVVRDNRMRARIPAERLDAALPYRPLPFVLDTVRLDVGRDHAPRTVRVKGGDGVRFEIAKCAAFDWFSVEPAQGVLKDGMAFTITFDESRMKNAPLYRGAFLVRTPDGLSRPVSLYVATDWRQRERCERPGDVAVYADPADAVRDAEGFDVYTFAAPKDARYYFMAFAQAESFSHAFAAVDEDEPEKTVVQSAVESPVWSILAPGRPEWSIDPGRIRYYDLKVGAHRLRVKRESGDFRPLAFVMTDNPLSFEPKVACGRRPVDWRKAFSDWPEGTAPETVANRIAEQFGRGLETFGPESKWLYRPEGYAGNRGYGMWGNPNGLHYCVAILWAHSIECARRVGNKALEEKLLKKFELFFGERRDTVPPPYHVDMTVFGLLPLKAFQSNGDPRARELGLRMADQQWAKPQASDFTKLTENVIAQNFPLERQLELWQAGYTPQTRLWIDDMFMITAVQAEAYRVTGDRRYIDRCAQEMTLYLDELQNKEGKDRGLFYHAPDVHYLWARGDGWMAAGSAMLLKALPKDNPHYPRILSGYRFMMAALRRTQRSADGLWDELLGDRKTWPEASGSAMFTYAFVEGVLNGWIADDYAPLARKAYLSLVNMLDEHGNIRNVCEGTAKKDDYRYYVDRKKVTGDPHGQAPMLWICEALMDVQAENR